MTTTCSVASIQVMLALVFLVSVLDKADHFTGMSPPPFEPGQYPQFQGQSGATSKITEAAGLATAGTEATTALIKLGNETGANRAIKQGLDETKEKYQNMKKTVTNKKDNFEADIPFTERHKKKKMEQEQLEEQQEKALENESPGLSH
ncbi:hypothetical protein EV361DRAFT_915974 [Lentinula raphanica]|nr:hypothetical protein EV361DRAFT_915974 [Lentinula raphanica]